MLFQAMIWYQVHHPAQAVAGFKDVHCIAHLRQGSRSPKSSRAAADYSTFFPFGLTFENSGIPPSCLAFQQW